MKIVFSKLFLLLAVIYAKCQNAEDIVVSSGSSGVCIYPLTSDEAIEKRRKEGGVDDFVYPLLILNNLIIRDDKLLNCFRNQVALKNIRKRKWLTKAIAEKRGIANVPKNGVLLVSTKKKYYIDLDCK